MQFVLHQLFPLGRFHATPGRVNPFDDHFGEWPPSPWRLLRAVVARWYQWSRETPELRTEEELDGLVRALCSSSFRFHLPEHARRGSPLRQYYPAEFGWNPGDKKKSAARSYGTSLAQDNYWCVPREEGGAIWWFVDGDLWTDQLVETLDSCLERMTYFGRSEAFTRIRRISRPVPKPNCELLDRSPGASTSGSVPVLVPHRATSRSDVVRVTDDPAVAGRTVPQGARVMYAFRPRRPPAREERTVVPIRTDCRLLQFAVGWTVAPEPRAVVRLTERFRSAVIGELLRIKSGDHAATWTKVSASVREAVAEMIGKDSKGRPLHGHRHTEFLAWWDKGRATRLVVWRSGQAFDGDEQAAILWAASRDISWAAAGPDVDAWKIKLIPLDAAIPAPPGFEGVPASVWESVTPYVPPRHRLRGGKPRDRESISSQIQRELSLRGGVVGQQVDVVELGSPCWVAVHTPDHRTGDHAFLGDRRGFWLRLRFSAPLVGPIRLGHSSSFGLGLFRPVTQEART